MNQNDYVPQPGDGEADVKKIVEALALKLEENQDSPDLLYSYCINLRQLGQTEKALKHLEAVPTQDNWYHKTIEPNAIGVLGFIGLAVLLNQTSAELARFFFVTSRHVGASIGWADVRLAVPYALYANREERSEEATAVLTACISSGIEPASAALPERISPVVLLLSLYKELGQEDELYSFIGKMPELLSTTGLEMDQVFEVVYAQDNELFEYIFKILKKRSPGNHE